MLDEQLLHNFVEVTAQNREGVVLSVQEGSELVHQGEVELWPLDLLLLGLLVRSQVRGLGWLGFFRLG